jgi:GrpB-like predicted nucleotidyltransferase (UPF0157 family)
MSEVTIVEARDSWADDFALVAGDLGLVLGDIALRIDHIGSTSVPGLDAKDVIDVQVTVASYGDLEVVADVLLATDYPVRPELHDHLVPGEATDLAEWVKRFSRERPGDRRANLHLRIDGHANQRYALLFRDFLRQHPDTAAAYGAFKRTAAQLLPDDLDSYADLKDPVCDLIYLAARDWAARTGWTP